MVYRESCLTLRSEQATRCTETQDRNNNRNTHQTRNERTTNRKQSKVHTNRKRTTKDRQRKRTNKRVDEAEITEKQTIINKQNE